MAGNSQEVFRTHANYIRSFAYLATHGSATRAQAYDRLVGRIEASGSLPAAVNAGADHDSVRRILENAWGTELLMDLGEALIDDDELIRLSNNWSAVQCYYSVYHAIQALVVAKGFPRPTSHPATQKMFADVWTQRRINLAPWSIAADATGYRNIPPPVVIDPAIHPWTGCGAGTCWSLACKPLRTTREDYVADAIATRRENKRTAEKRKWREEEAERASAGRRPRRQPAFPLPRLTVAERNDVNSRTRPASLMDYLYRVRIKTNYEDSAVFTDGPDNDLVSEEVRGDFCVLAGSSLLLHETHIAILIGKPTFLRWVEEWVTNKLPAGLAVGVAERLDIIRVFCR